MWSHKDITPEQKQAIVDCYLQYCDPQTKKIGKNLHHVQKESLQGRIVGRSAVNKIMAEYRKGKSVNPYFMFISKRCGGNNRKRSHEAEEAYKQILRENKFTPTNDAQHMLAAKGFHMSEKTVYIMAKDVAKRHREYLKPAKSQLQEIQRMKFCCDEVDENRGKFRLFNDQVHGDEKRFMLTRNAKLYHWPKDWNLPDDAECQHKGYIGWVMVLVVVAMPLTSTYKGEHFIFDGKIGAYAVTKNAIWVRGVRHPRRAELTAKRGVNAAAYCELLQDYVFPDIQNKMFFRKDKVTWYQHDGASCHRALITFDCQSLYDAIAPFGTGFIRVHRQPPQSPELNVLDLAIFNSISSNLDHIKSVLPTLEDLIGRIDAVFYGGGLTRKNLMVAWGVLAEVYRNVLKHRGKSFRAPHSQVRKRYDQPGQHVVDLCVCMDDYRDCVRIVDRYYCQHPDDINVEAEPDLFDELEEVAELE